MVLTFILLFYVTPLVVTQFFLWKTKIFDEDYADLFWASFIPVCNIMFLCASLCMRYGTPLNDKLKRTMRNR